MSGTTTRPVLVHGATLVDAGGTRPDSWLVTDGRRTTAVGTGAGWRRHAAGVELVDAGATPDRPALLLAPGLVDLHRHGGGGAAHEDGPAAVAAVAATHLRHGTTRGVASFVSAPVEVLAERLASAADVVEELPHLLGTHLEGPFLEPCRRGAHDPAALVDPTPAAVQHLLRAARGTLRQVTLDPARTGALDAVRAFRAAGVVVAVGHTDAGHRTAAGAFAAGATLLTHTFNAMRGIGHRDPGPVVAAVDAPGAVLELVLDGHHVHPRTAALLMASAPGRVALVTDAMAAAAGEDGRYLLGGLPVDVVDGRAVLAGTGTLAGSTLTLDAAVRLAVREGVDPPAAVGAATAVPARALGLARVGRLEPGCLSDLLLLDGQLRPVRVLTSPERAS